MATKTSEAKAKVSLDSTSFEKGAKSVVDNAKAMADTVMVAFASAGAAILAFAGIRTVGGILNSAHGVLTLAENLENAGHKAKIAAGQVYLFNNAFEKGINYETLAGMIGENAEVLNRSAATFRDVSIKLWAVGEKIRGFWLGLMDRLSPILSKLLDGALAQNLVKAGQAFGDAISNALKVIYQTAEDGSLWETFKSGFQIAFDYATERLVWLATIGGALFSEIISDGLNKGIVDGFKKLLDGLFELLGRAVYGLINFLRDTFLGVDDLSAEDAKQIGRKQDARIARGEDPNSKTGITKILNENKFNRSDDLATKIEAFSEVVKTSLAKFDKGKGAIPAQGFENNSRQAAIGADSMAAIGAGGNVYLGISVLDVNRRQLAVLERIEQKMTPIEGRQGRYYEGNPMLPMPEPYVTRAKAVGG